MLTLLIICTGVTIANGFLLMAAAHERMKLRHEIEQVKRIVKYQAGMDSIEIYPKR
jgi:hypothetical protein